MSIDQDTHWVFGYGSLIFRVDFPYLESRVAHINGWERRFWQGSHDHRGRPDAPGRVVTLVAVANAVCQGVAYRVSVDVFEHLDYREKNGYQRTTVPIEFVEGGRSDGIVYVADPDNHAYLGPASAEQIAAHILDSEGPSGRNSDYLLRLADSLRSMAVEDPHIFELEALVKRGIDAAEY